MDMADHLGAVRKNWWLVLSMLVLAVGAAGLLTSQQTPKYASSVTFFVSASVTTGTALQADEFAQRRINSYVGVLTSERLAQKILDDTGVDLTVSEVSDRISALADTNTVLLAATVTDTNAQRSLKIASAIANNLGPMVADLENRSSSGAATISLTAISGPTLDPTPVSPNKTLNLGIGFLVGLTLGVGLAIARQIADKSVRSAANLQELTGVPVLASVALDGGSRRSRPAAIADIRSPRAEAYRKLRTNLTFSTVDKRLQVIVVTSSIGGEGKSATAANLAMVLADAGKPVLLLEADLRRPSLGGYLGVESSVGLTNVLVGQVEADDVIQKWGPDGLYVLPSGTLPPNPSELLGSERMHVLMNELRRHFDIIVIDTPPLLPVTDAAIAGVMADGVVLVARHSATRRDQIATAVGMLQAVDANLVGTVLNMAPTTADTPDSYHSYHSVGINEPPSRREHRWSRKGAAHAELTP
jgi:capsular exopolysaccharide synthesis family protein